MRILSLVVFLVVCTVAFVGPTDDILAGLQSERSNVLSAEVSALCEPFVLRLGPISR